MRRKKRESFKNFGFYHEDLCNLKNNDINSKNLTLNNNKMLSESRINNQRGLSLCPANQTQVTLPYFIIIPKINYEFSLVLRNAFKNQQIKINNFVKFFSSASKY